MNDEINVNLKVDDYTNRVLGVIKEKFGLKDKGQALVHFTHEFGSEFVDREVSDESLKKTIEIANETFKKYGTKPLKKDSLKKLFEME